MMRIAVRDLILLYMVEKRDVVSQRMLSKALEIPQGTISKNLRYLIREGLIEDAGKRRVPGELYLVKVYRLTKHGWRRASETRKRLLTESIVVVNDGERNLPLSEALEYLEEKTSRSFMLAEIVARLHHRRLSVERLLESTSGYIDFADERPEVKRFYDRERELREMKKFIASPEARILVVRGIAGIGKTALLVKFVEGEKQKHNIFWHRFHRYSTPETFVGYLNLFLTRCGRRVKINEYQDEGREVNLNMLCLSIQRGLRDIDCILIFDDVHKLSGELIEFFSRFLEMVREMKNIKVILSGRYIPRGLYTEGDLLRGYVREITLGSLDRNASIQILRERGIVGNDAERIYEAVKGHPFLLALVRSPDMAVEEMNAFLRTEIYEHLSTEERDILSLASVFHFPFRKRLFLENNMSMDTVDVLVDKTLLQHGSGGRYDLHDIIREFVYERLTDRERRRYHRIAAMYYEKEEGVQAICEMIRHHIEAEDYEHAARALLKHRDILIKDANPVVLLNIIKRVARVMKGPDIYLLKGETLERLGRLDEALNACQSALEHAKKRNNETTIIMKTYIVMGRILEEKSRWGNALQFFNRALQLAEKGSIEENYIHYYIAYLYWRVGRLDLTEEHLNYIPQDMDPLLTARTEVLRGLVAVDRGEYERAIEHYTQAMDTFKGYGEKREIVRVYNNIAVAHARAKRYREALRVHKLQRDLAEEIGDLRGLAYAYLSMAGCYIELGEIDKAEYSIQKGMTLAKQLGEKLLLSLGHNQEALLYFHQKEFQRAKEEFERAIEMAEKLSCSRRQHITLIEYAKLLHEIGENEKAREVLKKSLRYYQMLGNERMQRYVEKMLEDIDSATN